MKIYVRHGDGQSEAELMFPSFRDFQAMYRLKFVGPEDLVRRENSSRWVRARDLPELRALQIYERSKVASAFRWLLALMLLGAALVIFLQLFLLAANARGE